MRYANTFREKGLSIMGTLVAVLLASAMCSWADSEYTVRKGDNLYEISRRTGAGVEAIKKASALSSNRLQPGMKLVIPSGGTPPAVDPAIEQGSLKSAEKGATVASKQASVTMDDLFIGPLMPSGADQLQTVRSAPRTYKVKKGDTLWKIAKRSSVSVRELKELNGLKSSRLKLSQVLLLEERQPEPIADDFLPLVTLADRTQASAEGEEQASDTQEGNSKLKKFMSFVARQTLGIPYKFGSNSKKSTDCSAYVQRVFRMLGIKLPRSAREQFKVGDAVEKKDLSIGDLVFFRTYAPFPSHVGIYLGNDLFIHASSFAKKVTIDSMNTPYFIKRFIGAKRLSSLDELGISEPSAEQPQIHAESDIP